MRAIETTVTITPKGRVAEFYVTVARKVREKALSKSAAAVLRIPVRHLPAGAAGPYTPFRIQ